MMGKSNGHSSADETRALFKLNLSVLQPGDVILTATPGIQGQLIKAVTGGNYSHAILVVKLPNGIESSDYGVVRFRLDRFVARDRKNIRVLRLREPKPTDFDKSIIRFSGDQAAKEYASYDVLTALFSRVPRFETRRFFCSQLVAACLKEAKVPSFEKVKPEKVSPANLASSELFHDVENAVLETSRSSFTFKPAYFDARNTQSPNERFTSACQKVVQSVSPIFEKHGIHIGSLSDALEELCKLDMKNAACVPELDRILLASMSKNRIADVGRDCWPSDSDDFFIDLTVEKMISCRGIDAGERKILFDFYADELRVVGDTLRERREFIAAAKEAYIVNGLEYIRYYMAGCWDFYLMHRRAFLAMERATEILRIKSNANEAP